MSPRDRVDLLIDIDRDYATYYRLSIDDRGWTSEDILADSSWNPTWYVAAAQDESQWTAEVAIPLDELSQHVPGIQDAWAVGVQRTVPNVGFQSWTEPAAIQPLPEGFGYLIFK